MDLENEVTEVDLRVGDEGHAIQDHLGVAAHTSTIGGIDAKVDVDVEHLEHQTVATGDQ